MLSKKILLSVSSIIVSFSLFSQNIQKSTPSDTIPLTLEVCSGILTNGLKYYIIKNDTLANEIEMALTVKAGSMHEDDDQLELAHMLEHMAMRGTNHFPNGAHEYLEKYGLKKKSHIQASTTAIATKYMLHKIPSGDSVLLGDCLQILSDWSHGLLLNSKKINIERGILLGEWTESDVRSANEKIFKILDHPKYCQNQVEEKIKNIRNFKHESLIRFYEDWYRPSLQSIIIVGDIDPERIEEEIKNKFSDLKNPKKPRIAGGVAERFSVQLTNKCKFIEIVTKQNTDVVLEIFQKQKAILPFGEVSTIDHYKSKMIGELYNAMVKIRFESLVLIDPHPPYKLVTNTLERNSIRNEAQIDALHTYIEIDNPKFLKQAVQSVIVELERIKKYGFSNSELADAKLNYNSINTANDNRSNASIIKRLINYFVYDSAFPSTEYECNLSNELLTNISLEEVNRASTKWLGDDTNRDIVLTTQEYLKDSLPNETDILNWIAEGKSREIIPHEHLSKAKVELLIFSDTLTPPSQIEYRISEIKEIETRTLILPNGAKIILKLTPPSTHRNNEILFHCLSPGGASLYKDESFFTASSAAEIISNSGIANLNKQELAKYLNTKMVHISPYITEFEEGIQGSSSPEGFEILMQLVYLYFVSPIKNQESFDNWYITKRNAILKNNTINDPKSRFEAAIIAATNSSYKTFDENLLRKVKFENAYNIYKERFSNANDFTFIIVGNFELVEVEPIILKYLGAIPGCRTKEMSSLPEKEVSQVSINRTNYYEWDEPHALVRLIVSGNYNMCPENNVKLEILKNLLNLKLTKTLRYEKGLTYRISTTLKYSRYMNGRYYFRINFDSAPEKAGSMIDTATSEIENLKLHGTDPTDFQIALATTKKEFLDATKRNMFWLSYLADHVRYNEDLYEGLHSSLLSFDQITIEDVNLAANEYLTNSHSTFFVLK